ncbi:MAG: hypothetical protein IPL28_05785 [Chloroflexi bacterium]|nr:hypothetical protein [Chloroflexota bacterium]
MSRSESGETAGGAEVQRSGAESPPLPNPKSKIENPAPSRPPLEKAWPVQRASEPATADSAAVSEPSYDPPAGTPPPREPSPEAVQAQEVMRHIAPEKASSSSVDFVMPTRPRPAPPVQRETAVPSSSSSPSPASEPQMVNTEIGQLPSDLWGLLGDTPPVQREEAAEYSHAVVDATGGVEEQGSRGAGEMEMSVQRVEEAEGQRSGGAEGMGAAVQREELPAADSAPSAPFMERTPSPPALAEEQRNGGAEEMGAPVQRQDGPEVTAPTRAEEQGSRGAGEVGAAVQRQEVPATPPPPSAPFTGHISSPSASAAGDLGEAEEAVAPVQRQESPEVTAPIIQAGEQGGRGAREMGAAVQRAEVPTADSAPSAPFMGDTSSAPFRRRGRGADGRGDG